MTRTQLYPWLAILASTAMGCSEAKDPAPQPAGPVTVSAETFNVFLAGAYSDYWQERRPAIVEAIAAMPSDVVCLQEVWNQADKELVIQGAKAKFPHAISYLTDLETPVDDPTDQNGVIPPAPTQAPCADADSKAKLDAAYQCLIDNCSTIPGSGEGTTTSTSCASSKCLGPAAQLISGAPKCYGCLASSLPTDKLSDIYQACTTNPKAGLSFQGQNGLVLLSKHPLTAAAMYVMPGTWLRRVAIGAVVNLPGGGQLDAYCTHTTPGWSGFTYPYTGEYGNGAKDVKGWEAELALQVKKLGTWVQSRSADRKALIMGDFNAGPENAALGLEAASVEAYALATQLWAEGAVAGYTPACTFCSKQGNPLADGKNAWIDHVFVKSIPAADLLSTERTFTEAVVPVAADPDAGGDGGPSKVPLSDHYGMRLTFRL